MIRQSKHFGLRCVSFRIPKLYWLRMYTNSVLSNFAPCMLYANLSSVLSSFKFVIHSAQRPNRCRQISIISIFKIKLRSVMRKFWTSKQWHSQDIAQSIQNLRLLCNFLSASEDKHAHRSRHGAQFIVSKKRVTSLLLHFTTRPWLLARSQLFEMCTIH